MTLNKLDAPTQQQLLQLGYNSDDKDKAKRHHRPLLICDVDEVVLHLVTPFAAVLEERGYFLKAHSFQLTGNIFHKETGREASQEEVWAGLDHLFKEQTTRQPLVEGAVEHLNQLAQHIDILFLTNLPHSYGAIRRRYLMDNGLDFPLITNVGSKVSAIQNIQTHCDYTVGFIDDTPKNLLQVNKHLPTVELFHFMADETFRQLAGPIDGAHCSCSDWAVVSPIIRNILMENKKET